MCGRFVGYRNLDELKEIFPIDRSACEVTANYNVAPSQKILAIFNHQGQNWLDKFHWGLVPFWAKDPSIGNRMINARAETVAEKPSFKSAFKKRRCLIIADGFYEWKTTDKRKIPFFIHFKDSEPFALAGLWDQWTNKTTGEEVVSSSIITTSPNNLIEEIHNRMPVILDPQDYQTWLSPGNMADNVLMACLKTYPSNEMDVYEISRKVNSPANDNPEIIQPYASAETSSETLF